MEDQGKRLLLATAIVFAGLMVWSVLFPPPVPESETTATDSSPTVKGGLTNVSGEEARQNGDQPNSLKDASSRSPDIQRGAEEKVVFDFPSVRIELSTYGGAVSSWQLKRDQFRTDEGELLDLVPVGAKDEGKSFTLDFVDGSTGLDPSTLPIVGASKTEWKIISQSARSATLELLPDYSPGLQIQKEYTFSPEDHMVTVKVITKNLSSKKIEQALVIDTVGFEEPGKDEDKGSFGMMAGRYWAVVCNQEGTMKARGNNLLVKDGPGEMSGQIFWTGLNHAYFLAAVAPRQKADRQYICQADAVPSIPGAMRSRLIFPQTTIKPGGKFSREVYGFFGPKYLDKMEVINSKIGFDPQFSNSVEFGFFEVIARPLLWLLVKIFGFVQNWGLAIILLTFLVKLATLYWTNKSMRSMKEMASLKPQTEAIQAKYKDDKQKQQQEIMAMYKARGVNPLASCLPMFLQMPIWFALYRMLMRATELYRAKFLWIQDLTSPDPLYILPVLVMIAMFVQTRLSPTNPDSTQQKVMMYGMPLMFGAFSFVFPSGLVLYMLTNTVLTAIHSLWMHNGSKKPSDEKTEQKEVAAVSTTTTTKASKKNKAISGRNKSKK